MILLIKSCSKKLFHILLIVSLIMGYASSSSQASIEKSQGCRCWPSKRRAQKVVPSAMPAEHDCLTRPKLRKAEDVDNYLLYMSGHIHSFPKGSRAIPELLISSMATLSNACGFRAPMRGRILSPDEKTSDFFKILTETALENIQNFCPHHLSQMIYYLDNLNQNMENDLLQGWITQTGQKIKEFTPRCLSRITSFLTKNAYEETDSLYFSFGQEVISRINEFDLKDIEQMKNILHRYVLNVSPKKRKSFKSRTGKTILDAVENRLKQNNSCARTRAISEIKIF